MALGRTFLNRNHIESKEVGFGKTDNVQQRLMNADGSYNFVRVGLPWYESFNFYHFLINISWVRFIFVVIIWYTVMNLIFTGLYFGLCANSLTGMVYSNGFEHFMEVYFFSAQTLTTVGYGRINPLGIMAGAIASLEALVGLLSFALFTGLLYARFAKPNANLLFSKNAVFAPFGSHTGLMFRLANQLSSSLINTKAQVTLSIMEWDEKGNSTRKFYTPLNLERDSIIFFPSSWTLVHPIDENSPLFGLTWEDIEKGQPELLVLISGYDESFNDTVINRHSYHFSDMVWGAKFVKMLNTNAEGMSVVDLSKIDNYDKVMIDELVGKV
jgi:inward rectifier potassium channel